MTLAFPPELAPPDFDPVALVLEAEKNAQAASRKRKALQQAEREARQAALGHRRLSPADVEAIVAAAATGEHTPAQLARQFGVALPTILYHTNKAQVALPQATKLNADQTQLIAYYPAVPAELAARAFGVSVQHVYALRRRAQETQAEAAPKVGYKVTAESLKTILDLRLSAFDAAQQAGVSVPTVHNYRRAARASQAAPAAASDLV